MEAGETTFPRDLLILAPSLVTIPCVKSARKGSCTSRWPRSASALQKKRAYIRCRIACSTPPMYWSTGIHSWTASCDHAASSLTGSQYRRKYQDESTNVSIVSVSRLAAPPHDGHATFTQSSAAASGERPFGA